MEPLRALSSASQTDMGEEGFRGCCGAWGVLPSEASSGRGSGVPWDGGYMLACYEQGDNTRWMVPQLTEMDN